MASSDLDPEQGSPRGLGMALLAGWLAAAGAVWDFLFLHGYDWADWWAQPGYCSAHLALDVVISWPVAAAGLVGAWVLTRGEVSGWRAWTEVVAVACSIGYVILLLLIPTNAFRVLAHPAMDRTVSLVPAGGGLGSLRLPSYGAETRWGLLHAESLGGNGRLVAQLGWHGLRSALMSQCVLLPILALGVSLTAPWRARLWRRRRFVRPPSGLRFHE